MDWMLPLCAIAFSMLVIWRACDGFEAASSYLGRNLSDGVRGATINAIGSSLPELLATSVALLLYLDKEGFAFGVGTTAGSAIFNSAVIPAMVIMSVTVITFGGFVKYIEVSRKVILRDGIALLLAEAVLIILLSKGTLTFIDGAILLAVYISYIVFMFATMGKSDEQGSENSGGEDGDTNNQGGVPIRLLRLVGGDLRAGLFPGSLTTFSASVLIAVATAVIGAACFILVEACYSLGDALEIRTYFIAVILAAAATSVPDTILSIKDAKKGNYDDAVSNALGSNIFDICVCLGAPLCVFTLFVGPISLDVADGSVAELRVLLFAFTLVAFGIYFFGQKMGKVKGVMLLSLYVSFVWYIYSRATGNPVALEIGEYLQSALGWFSFK